MVFGILPLAGALANHASKRPGPATSTPLAGPLLSQDCGHRRRARHKDTRHPGDVKDGPRAPVLTGGRHLTLYLKVAITGPPGEFRWMVRGGWVLCSLHLVAPLTFGKRAPRRIRSQATAQKHQGPQARGT